MEVLVSIEESKRSCIRVLGVYTDNLVANLVISHA